MNKPRIYIALPVMDESIMLPLVLKAIEKQSVKDYQLHICVNQPDEYWYTESGRTGICLSNQESMRYISSLNDSRIVLIDKSSPGKGWLGKRHGIGWARKTIMDTIAGTASDHDIILSLDADTLFSPGYFESVITNFELNPDVVAISIPYYHQLTGEEKLDRAMLRYEIYMRAYAINLWRIGSPYCFTALGSAIALPVKSYKAIGGMTPKLSGEDFYFLQKLVKYGKVLHWNGEGVFPSARLSERVFFGTGPALIKGLTGDWNSYPVYHPRLFDEISNTYALFPDLYYRNIPTPMDHFLLEHNQELPWENLRKNSGTLLRFVRACHEKIDGLRLLQFLKGRNITENIPDEESLESLFEILAITENSSIKDGLFSFTHSTVERLDVMRNQLVNVETEFRKRHWNQATAIDTLLN